MQKSCYTCKHGEKRAYDEPCRTCLEKAEWGKWEPGDTWRPEMLPEVVTQYESEYSTKPDSIRVSFVDGSTEIYDRRLRQPEPTIIRNIEIIQGWNTGYQYQPKRRRRAKR